MSSSARCFFNAPAVTVVMERHHLSAAQGRAAWSMITIEDVARERRGGAPRNLLDVVVEQVRALCSRRQRVHR